MSLELIRETIKANQVIGQGSAQTVIENDIIVPDSKPDISRILLLDGDVYVTGTEVLQDRVMINGSIAYKILYLPDDAEQTVKGINTKLPFSLDLGVDNVRQGMACKVKCDIEHIDYEVLNGRKLGIKTVLKAAGRVSEETAQSLVYDLDGAEDIQVLKGGYTANCFIGSGSAGTSVRESIEIPAGKPSISEILRTDAKISGIDYKIADNKVAVKGELNVSTLYVADDETKSLQVMEHGIPFTQFVDLVGITEDASCQVDLGITEASFEPEEDSDGELRNFKCDVNVQIYAEAYGKKNLEYIDDAYSPKARIEIEKGSFKMREYTAENLSQAVLKEVVILEDENPDISEVFNVLGKPSISEYAISGDRVTIEGAVSCRVLYLANDAEQPVYVYEQELPLKHVVELKGINPDMDCDINLDIEHCNYSMLSSKEVEIRVVLSVLTRVINQVEVPVITKAIEAPLDDKRLSGRPSITIYFSQPGDSLWSIAKKYYTTIADIQRINDINDEALKEPGQQIIIPKRN